MALRFAGRRACSLARHCQAGRPGPAARDQVLIDRKRTSRCYVNAWLALKDADGVPLPEDHEGEQAPEACPK